MGRLIDADKLKQQYSWWNDVTKELFDEIIDLQPTVDAVKHGHDTQEDRCFHCSVCGYGVADVYESSMSAVYVFEHGKEWNYCPNCGAKMDKVESE